MSDKVIQEIAACFNASHGNDVFVSRERLELILEREKLEAWLEGAYYCDPLAGDFNMTQGKKLRLAAVEKELGQ